MVSVFGTTAKVERWTGEDARAEFVHSKCMWCVYVCTSCVHTAVSLGVCCSTVAVVCRCCPLHLSLPSSSCLPFVCQQRRFACLQMCLPSFVLSSAAAAAAS